MAKIEKSPVDDSSQRSSIPNRRMWQFSISDHHTFEYHTLPTLGQVDVTLGLIMLILLYVVARVVGNIELV